MAICFAEQNGMCNFKREHNENHFCEIILNLDQWFRKRSLKDILIYSSGNPFSVERNHLCNYGRGHYKEHFYEKRLNLDQWFVQEVMSLKEGSYLEFWQPS